MKVLRLLVERIDLSFILSNDAAIVALLALLIHGHIWIMNGFKMP